MNNRRSINNQRGFSTLEILIAITIGILTLSAVLLVSFGNQSLALDSETATEAQHKAQELLEAEQADARFDFNQVNSLPVPPATFIQDGIYKKTVDVEQLDSYTKRVTANVVWTSDHNRDLNVSLSTLVTDPNGFANNTACNSVLTNPEGWKNPQHFEHTSSDIVNQATGNSSDGLGIADMAVMDQRLYIASKFVANNDHNFYVSSLPTDPSQWPSHQGYLGSVDTNGNGSGGLAAVVVANVNSSPYAFIANTNNISTKGHLQIVDISNPNGSIWNPNIVRYRLPSVATDKLGNSIFYSNGFVYLGLTGTASGGTEFNIIDVNVPGSPQRIGGYATGGRTVNSIFVKDNYAYIATADNADASSRVMAIIDVNVGSPTFAQKVGGWTDTINPPNSNGSGSNHGKSIFVVGNTAYLGRTYGTNEFNLLNVLNFGSVSRFGVRDVGAGNQTSINGLAIRDFLAFFLTKTQFQVWNITNTSSITPWTSDGTTNTFLTFEDFINGNGNNITGSSLYCEGDAFYISIATPQGQDKDVIWVLTPGP